MRIRIILAATVWMAAAQARAEDWLIGYDDPNEVVVQTDERLVDGDIYILNSGRLHIQDATVTVFGSIFVVDAATLQIDGGTLQFGQSYTYQSEWFATDSATVQLTDATIDGGGYPYSVALAGNATAVYQRVTVVNGFSTWALFDQACATLTDCVNGGEFSELGENTLTISGTQTVLYWLALPDGSAVDVAFPAPGDVPAWSVTPDSPWATGIPYTFTLTDATDVMWAVMGRSGSSGTFHDSALRAVGSIFEHDNTVHISGVANQAALLDTSYTWGDIDYHFLNCTVQAWNYYCRGQTELTLDDCVFGELLVGQTGSATMNHALCDGSGGYIEVADSGILQMVLSAHFSQLVCEQNALVFVLHSALMSHEVDVLDNAALLLLNSTYVGLPRAHTAGTVFDVAIDPVDVPLGSVAELRGSARLVRGPDSPFHFAGYTVDCGQGPEPETWTPLFEGTTPVDHGVLGTWDTCGYAAGMHTLRLELQTEEGEPVALTSPAELLLLPGPGCGPGDVNCDGRIDYDDIDAFVLLLSQPWQWQAEHPGCPWLNGDLNGDETIDYEDIDPFVAMLGS